MKINKRSVSDSQIDEKRDDKEKRKKTVIVFVICFLLVLFSLFISPFFNISPPYSWAKTGLTTAITPKNLERTQNLFISGVLMGDDVDEKEIVLQVTDDEGNLMTTYKATTDGDGFYDYTWSIPAGCSIGKHDITASYELLSDTENFMVKLAAPQEYGEKYFN
ncbi:MAG: hypothetical protein V3S97_08195 [Candidatus Bathyarchaeia archaeon]